MFISRCFIMSFFPRLAFTTKKKDPFIDYYLSVNNSIKKIKSDESNESSSTSEYVNPDSDESVNKDCDESLSEESYVMEDDNNNDSQHKNGDDEDEKEDEAFSKELEEKLLNIQ